MKFLLSLTLLITCVGCGSLFEKKDNEPQPTKQPIELLREKAVKYANWARDLEDDQGTLVEYFECDSLLWQSLYEVATDGDIDISIYEGEDGEWFRKPTHDCIVWDEEKEEWVSNGSKSSISRDMFLGLLHLLWARQDLNAIERIIDFGRDQSPKWFMGQGINFIERESRTHLRGPLLGTLFVTVFELGGEDNAIRKFPYTTTGEKKGFLQHLEVLHTLLRGQMFGGVSDTELTSLGKACDRNPANAFYCATYHYFKDGDQSAAIASLLNESLFPADRLPNGQDRCSGYIFQRDDDRADPDPDNDDWKPCNDGSAKQHTPVDFLWAFKIIDNSLVNTAYELTIYPLLYKE